MIKSLIIPKLGAQKILLCRKDLVDMKFRRFF